MSTFDVWVIRFEPGEAPPAERLQAAFGIDSLSARALEQSVPKIVKHAVPAKAAGEMRLALEAVGAVVECRPARDVDDAARAGRAAVFHRPKEDLFPSNRPSAVDPSSHLPKAGEPALSLDESVRSRPAPKSMIPSDAEQPRRITASLLATSRAQQRRKFLRQALATIVAGGAILTIDWLLGNSILRGEADWIGIGIDGLGIYFVGLGVHDLVVTLRG
jgi:hypothetical protein